VQSVLECRKITKHFPGIKALDEVDFNIRPGEVHALIGENGAGKSTLVKIITGIHQPDSGVILQNGEPVEFRNPTASQLAGIAAIHQEATMFPELSVTENIYMGHHLTRRVGRLLDWKGMKLKTRSLLEKLDLDINLDTKVKDLSVAQRHMVEIVKALSLDAKIVIMDEPTSALSLREVEDLYKIIRQLKAAGQGIVFISHKFEDIYEIADYFTVLRDGRYIGEGQVAETEVDEIVRMMVGRSLDQMFPKSKVQLGDTILKVEGLSRTGIFKDVSFDLHCGEILGFFGLVGAGRSEVMQAVFGIDTATSGKISVKGRELSITSPPVAMDHGIAYVPEDRQIQGTILDMSIQDNITLPIVDKLASYSLLNSRKEREVTREFGERMEIKTSGWTQAVNSLSGGNQQKVVLAKWLATHPEILIMDEPTKGIDVATKARVHEFISQLAAEGLAIILISSEIPEILGMADRIVVMYEGKITACLNRSEADSETLVKAAMGNSLPQKSA
jgi:rhamnose transport system ATP-binding protein